MGMGGGLLNAKSVWKVYFLKQERQFNAGSRLEGYKAL
jgi:hypothetical protein